MTQRVGIIGTGTMAEIYAEVILQSSDAELIAICGNTENKTRNVAEKYGAEPFYSASYEKFFEGSSLDAVIICTPEKVRFEPVRLAVKNKLCILLEKPVADNLLEGKKILDLLIDYSKTIEICHVLRHSPRFTAAVEAIKQNKIGEIRHIAARRDSNQERAKRVLGKTDLAFWLAPHDVDIFLWYCGDAIDSVRAYTRSNEYQGEDFIVANIRTQSGILFVLQVSWCCPPLSGTYPAASHEVWGSKGYININDSEMNISLYQEDQRVYTFDTYECFKINGVQRGYFESMLASFISRCGHSDISHNEVNINVARENIGICQMISDSILHSRETYRSDYEW